MKKGAGSYSVFKKSDKNDEVYLPETEQFQQKVEKDEKKNAAKRKSSSGLTQKIKQIKI